jgi:VIT1/CCC1 family predicted Fe2+/Mn2+ transporter
MHSILRPSSVHRRGLGAESIRELVFGVEDGVVQNMTLIAGMVGAALSSKIILIAAAINAIAGVLSMSMGTYLSSQAERDVALAGQNASDRTSIDPEPAVNDHSPRRDALVMASAYAVGATIPLLPFIGGFLDDGPALVLAMALAGLTLFFLGVGKGSLSNQHRIRSGLQMLVLASAAGLAGYFLGVLARAVFGLDA